MQQPLKSPFKFLTSQTEIEGHIRALNDVAGYVVLDTEFTSLNFRQAELIDVQLSGLQADEVVAFSGSYAKLLEKVSIPLVVQNFKADFYVLYKHGVDLLDKEVLDTMLLHHILYPEADSHSLEAILEQYGLPTDNKQFWKKYTSYLDAPLNERLEYACRDIVEIKAIYERLKKDFHVRFNRTLP